MRKIKKTYFKNTIFKAFLENGEHVLVSYRSEFIDDGVYVNTLISCLYKGVNIEPLFKFNGLEDMPCHVYREIEKDAKILWNKKSSVYYPETRIERERDKPKPVIMLKRGKVISQFPSMWAAAKSIKGSPGGISNVCRGINKQYKGYQFSFL